MTERGSAHDTLSGHVVRITWITAVILVFQVTQYGFERKWEFIEDLSAWTWSLPYIAKIGWADWLKLLLLTLDSFVKAAVTSITWSYISIVNNHTLNQVTTNINQTSREVSDVAHAIMEIRNRIMDPAAPGAPLTVDAETRELLARLVREASDERIKQLDELLQQLRSSQQKLQASDTFFQGLEALLAEVRKLREDIRGGR